jgi:hypothetical protein
MSKSTKGAFQARIIHRYLGFFLAGVMAIYAISGITLVFRQTDTFKIEHKIEKDLAANLSSEALGRELRMRNFKADKVEDGVIYFKDGTYNQASGAVAYSVKELPFVLDKLTHLHKATTKDPLFFFNIFFGFSLLIFVVTAFWMYLPSGPILRKGLLFTAGGILLILLMLFV